MMSNSNPGRPRAFTIVELLAVIAILAVLVAMLIPAIRKVTITARSLTCISNLRQLGVGEQSYALTWHWVLPHQDPDGLYWHQNPFFRRAMGLSERDARSTSGSVWPGTILCPSAKNANWTTQQKLDISNAYGMNHENTRRTGPTGYGIYTNRWYLYGAVKHPDVKLLLMDAPAWECTMNQRNDYVYETYYNSSGSVSGACAYRHGMQNVRAEQLITVLFFDFHVDQRTRAQITGSDGQWMYWK